MHILCGKWKANNASENRQITEQWRVLTSALQGYHDNTTSVDPKALAATPRDMPTIEKEKAQKIESVWESENNAGTV